MVATLWVVKWQRRLNNWNILWSLPLYVLKQSFVSSCPCFKYSSNYSFLRPSEVIFSRMIRNEVLLLHRTTFKTLVRFTRHELLHRRFPRPMSCRPVTFGNKPVYFSNNTHSWRTIPYIHLIFRQKIEGTEEHLCLGCISEYVDV